METPNTSLVQNSNSVHLNLSVSRLTAVAQSQVTLAAFIPAAAAWAYRKSLLQKERLIRKAPEHDRAELVENALEFFKMETSGLTRQQQYNLALKQIHAKAIKAQRLAQDLKLLSIP